MRCNAILHAAIGQRPYCGYKAAETMMAESRQVRCLALTHARRAQHTFFVPPSLPRSRFHMRRVWLTLREIWEHRPRIMAGWLERLISAMKAIIIDIALDLSLLSRRFQGVKPSETYLIQLLLTWDFRLESTATPPCNYPLGSPDEMMQAAGIHDRSYSVRHGGAQRITSPRSAYSRIASSSFTRDFAVNYGRCQR